MFNIPWIIVALALASGAAAFLYFRASPSRRWLAAPLAIGFLAAAVLAFPWDAAFNPAYRVYLRVWPQEVVPVLILADAGALFFLVSLWAGMSAAHWFWRLAALFGALASLAPIEAVEPMLMLAIAMPAVALVSLAYKRWRKQGTRADAALNDVAGQAKSAFRIRLGSIFLAFVIVGLVALIIREVVHTSRHVLWLGLASEAVIFVAVGLSAATVASAGKRRLVLVAVSCAAVAAGIAWHAWYANDWAGWRHVISCSSLDVPWLAGVGLIIFGALVAGVVGLGSLARSAEAGSATRKTAMLVAAVCCVLLAVPLARVYWEMLPPRDLAVSFGRPPNVRSTALEQLASTNWSLAWVRDARPKDRFDVQLEVAARIFEAPGAVWINPDEYRRRILERDRFPELDLMINFYWHFDRALWLAKSEGKLEEAKQHLSTQLRITELLCSSNLPQELQIGYGVQFTTGLNYLELLPHMTDAEIADFTRRLDELHTRRKSMEELAAMHEALEQHSLSWRQRLRNCALEFAGDPWSRRSRRTFSTRYKESMKNQDKLEQTPPQLLRTHLALESYRRRHGRWPDELRSLVPEIVDEIPVDPFSTDGQPPIYRRTGDNFLLYSVSSDGRDDGGITPQKDADWLLPGHDLTLEYFSRGSRLPWRPQP